MTSTSVLFGNARKVERPAHELVMICLRGKTHPRQTQFSSCDSSKLSRVKVIRSRHLGIRWLAGQIVNAFSVKSSIRCDLEITYACFDRTFPTDLSLLDRRNWNADLICSVFRFLTCVDQKAIRHRAASAAI